MHFTVIFTVFYNVRVIDEMEHAISWIMSEYNPMLIVKHSCLPDLQCSPDVWQ